MAKTLNKITKTKRKTENIQIQFKLMIKTIIVSQWL